MACCALRVLAREREAVEHQMGCAGEQERILPARRLALGTVGDHHGTAARPGGDGLPFGRDGEPGTPVAHQSAGGELLEHAGLPMAHGPPAFEVGL